MAVGPLLKSALKVAAEEFPDTFKTQSAIPMLTKKGVKPEELTFSGVGEKIAKAQELGTERISKSALESAIPEGQFGETVLTGKDTLYNWVSVDNAASNPTYKERIITFGEPGRYTSSHFPADGNVNPDNYLMHNRVYDEQVDGVTTRVLSEIQSDLHQTGRREGYMGTQPTEAEIGVLRKWASEQDNSTSTVSGAEWDKLENEAYKIAERAGLNVDSDDMVDNMISLAQGGIVAQPSEAGIAAISDALRREAAGEIDEDELVTIATANGWRAAAGSIDDWIYSGAQETVSNKLPPKSPWEKQWLKKGIELEIADAAEQGLTQLAIPISGEGLGALQRSAGVDKWYETTVVNTAKKIAKQMGGEFTITDTPGKPKIDIGVQGEEASQDFVNTTSSIINDDLPEDFIGYAFEHLPLAQQDIVSEKLAKQFNVTEGEIDELLTVFGQIEKFESLVTGKGNIKTAMIKFPLGKKPDFKLYASPLATGGAIALYTMGQQEGYSDEELIQFAESKGMAEDMQFIVQAKGEGYNDEQIQAYLQGPTEVQNAESEFLDPAVDLEELKSNPSPKNEAYAKILDPELEMDFGELLSSMKVIHPNMTSVSLRTAAFFGNEAAARQADEAVAAQAQKIVNTAQRSLNLNMTWDQGSGTFFIDLPHGKFEVTESILDSIESEGGELLGAIAGGSIGAYFGGKTGNGWLTLGSSILGAVGGSIAGTQVDYLRESMQLQTEMHAEVAAHKALTAAEASIIGDVVGMGVFKGLGKGWSFLDNTYQMVKDGNSKGAAQAMRDVLFVSESEAEEVVRRLDTVLTAPLEGNQAQREIQAIMATKQGSNIIVKAASQIDPLAGQATIKAIDDRAKDLGKTASALTDENVGRVIREDLANYVSDTKAFYQSVKDQAAASPYANNFKFNFEKLALNPALAAVKRNLMSRGDSTTLERFALQAQRINGMSESRSFSDLIELRQLVNDFLFNKKVTNAKDSKALFDVRGRIDAAIDVGARVVLRDQSDMWQANFSAAKSEYAKMKVLEKNVLNRVLSRPGVSEKAIVQGLTKYITAIDGTFTDVMAKLPKPSRYNVEGAVIDNLTEKFTAGMGDGLRAVHFPLLNDELKKVAFTSPQARQYKAMVQEFSEIFKNDVPLSLVSGQIQIPKFQSYLTADPLVRAKFEIASGVFNTIKTFVPGKEQRNMALVKNVAKLLETPLNSKAAKDVMATMAEGVDVSAQVVQLQQEAALASMKLRDKEEIAVRLYGEGAVKTMKGAIKSAKMPAHRIASQADVKNVADQDGILMSDALSLDYALKQRGYAGVLQGADKVRVLK